MTAAGQAAIDAARADGRWDAAYAAQSTAAVPDDLAAALAGVPGAVVFFAGLDSANRHAILYRLHTASPALRGRKLDCFAQMRARGETLHLEARKRG